MSSPTANEPRFTSGADVAAQRPATSQVDDVGRGVTYWLTIAGIYIAQGALWYYGAYEKIVGGHMKAPAGIEKAFSGSFIASFPGTGFAWAVISIAEAIIVVGLLASLIRLEFLPHRTKPLLLASMGFSLVVLGALLFGQSMIGEHDSVYQLFTYGAGTLVMMAAVLWLSPGGARR